MKKLFILFGIAALYASCGRDSVPPASDVQRPQTMTIYASVAESPVTEASISDSGVPAWQTGDQIALYNGSSFVAFTLDDPATGAFTGPAGDYTGLAVYPAAYAGSVNGSGELTISLPSSFAWEAGQTNAPMIASGNPASYVFYPVAGLFKFTYTDIPSDATAFHFTVPSRINGDFNIGVPNPGTSVMAQVAASNDSEKTVAVSLPSPHPTEMSFYIPVPVSPSAGYAGFAVSITGNDGVPAAEVSSSTNYTVARSQMRRFKSKSCADALPAKIYLIGGCLNPNWDWSNDNALTKGTGAVYTGTISIVNTQGFKMYLNNDWNATWLSIDETNSTASNLIVVGGEAYKAAHGVGDTQVYPSAYGYESNVYDVTLDLSTKKLTLNRRLFLVGSPFTWGWSFDGTPMKKISENVYRAADVAMDFGGDGWNGFRIYTKYEVWNELYTYKDGGYDASGITLTYHDEWGDPPQISPGRYGYANGTYDVEFNTSTLKLTLTVK